MISSRPMFWFGVCTMLFAGGWFAWRVWAAPTDSTSPVFLSIFFAMLLVVPAFWVASILPRVGATRRTLWTIILAAGVVRVLLLGVDPFLSDDLYRCLWDGQVQREGLDPYLAAPADLVFDPVAENSRWHSIRQQVNHPDVPTVYPPLSQLFFRVVAHTEFSWRFSMLCLDMILGGVLAVALRRAGQDPRRAILWWWHPLPILECAIGGHPEIIAVLLMTVAIVLLTANRGRMAAVAIGAAIVAKLLPVGWIPLLVRRGGGKVWVPLLITMLVLLVPFAGSDPGPASEGLREYGSSWYSGDLLFRPLGELLGLNPEDRYSAGAQWLRGFLFLAWLAVAWHCRAVQPWRGFLLVSLAFALLSPTLHPWYLLWLLPAAIMERSRASMLLTCTILFQYRVLDDWRALAVWELPAGTRALVFGVPLLLIIHQWWRERAGQSSIPVKG